MNITSMTIKDERTEEWEREKWENFLCRLLLSFQDFFCSKATQWSVRYMKQTKYTTQSAKTNKVRTIIHCTYLEIFTDLFQMLIWSQEAPSKNWRHVLCHYIEMCHEAVLVLHVKHTFILLQYIISLYQLIIHVKCAKGTCYAQKIYILMGSAK